MKETNDWLVKELSEYTFHPDRLDKLKSLGM
jgi:hypothetical protein